MAQAISQLTALCIGLRRGLSQFRHIRQSYWQTGSDTWQVDDSRFSAICGRADRSAKEAQKLVASPTDPQIFRLVWAFCYTTALCRHW